METFDLVVIGSGTAASSVISPCREAGWSVAVVDNQPYGGTCPLRGCDPKKVLRRGAEVVDAARLMRGKGIEPGGIGIDWRALQQFKRSFTDPMPAEREQSFEAEGVATFHGTARFVDRTVIEIDGRRIEGRHFAIAAGMKPRPLGIPGAELAVTSTRFLELEGLPRRVLFIGGGYIAFEFAHMAARTASTVTMLSRGPRPLKGFDPDLVDRLVDRSRGLGIDLVTEAEVQAIERRGGAFAVRADIRGETRWHEADLVVHGAGRVPAIDELDLDRAGVRTGKGGVEVNEFLQSPSNPAVYAAGDAAASAGAPLTPVASLEGKTVAANLLRGNHAKPDYTGVPSAVFTVPALAKVGLLQAEAKRQGADFTCKFSDMSDWYSVRRVGETHAGAKVLIENGTDRILGAHILAPEAPELIDLFALAMRNGLKAQALRDVVSAYPSAASDLPALV